MKHLGQQSVRSHLHHGPTQRVLCFLLIKLRKLCEYHGSVTEAESDRDLFPLRVPCPSGGVGETLEAAK